MKETAVWKTHNVDMIDFTYRNCYTTQFERCWKCTAGSLKWKLLKHRERERDRERERERGYGAWYKEDRQTKIEAVCITPSTNCHTVWPYHINQCQQLLFRLFCKFTNKCTNTCKCNATLSHRDLCKQARLRACHDCDTSFLKL